MKKRKKMQILVDNIIELGKTLSLPPRRKIIEVLVDEGSKNITDLQNILEIRSYKNARNHVNELIRKLKVDEGGYDATRGEMESFVERGEMSNVLEPIIFKTTTKHDMATNFEKMVENKEVELLNDRRMLDQILVVDNDLKSLETPEGHGDSFWSIAMALWVAGQKTEGFDAPIY